MQSRAERKRRLNDLYIDGETVELKDGSTLYMRVLNPYERSEVTRDAAAARSRFILAMKRVGSDEYDRARGSFWSAGKDSAIEQIIEINDNTWMIEAANAIRDDPEWEERMEIMDRSDELVVRPESDAERKLLSEIQDEFITEMKLRHEGRIVSERAERQLRSEEELMDEYLELWRETKAAEVSTGEYQISELWYAVRLCEATRVGDGEWDHGECDDHRMRLYEDKQEIRELSAVLQELLMDRMASINMSVRDAKNSDRPRSSSDSAPRPSEAGESEPSTETEASPSPPGTSPQPLPMP